MRPRVATLVVPCSLLFSVAAWRLDPQGSFGALSRGAMSDGMFWSLGTYSFLHIGWMHYLINMFGLLAVSVVHRSIGDGLGARHEWGAYCAGVLGGGFAHVAVDPFFGVVGASAGVLGLLAAVMFAGDDGHSGTFGLGTMRIGAAILAVTAVVPGLAATEVSIASHCGGVVAGIAYGAYWRRARALGFLKI
jgi:membrane associated rhomboid family serine protease